jgi:hypothetical protein
VAEFDLYYFDLGFEMPLTLFGQGHLSFNSGICNCKFGLQFITLKASIMSNAKTPEEKAAAKQKAAEKAVSKQAAKEQSGKNSDETDSNPSNSESTPVSDSVDSTQNQGNSESRLGQDNAPEETNKKLAVVIPYLKLAAQGKELLYAVRSIAKNFSEDFQLVVIGDKEDWFGEEILHINHACIGADPQSDVIEKMKEILMDERIGDDFVWSNDDIYFVRQTSLADIKVLKVDGELMVGPIYSLYDENKGKTFNALKGHDLPTRNFDVHMPFFFEKSKMVDVFEMFPEMESQGLLIASMYLNLHNDESVPADVHMWESDKWLLRVISKLETEEKKNIFRKLIGTKHFLNHSESGYSTLLMEWLSRQFADKCRFEK